MPEAREGNWPGTVSLPTHRHQAQGTNLTKKRKETDGEKMFKKAAFIGLTLIISLQILKVYKEIASQASDPFNVQGEYLEILSFFLLFLLSFLPLCFPSFPFLLPSPSLLWGSMIWVKGHEKMVLTGEYLLPSLHIIILDWSSAWAAVTDLKEKLRFPLSPTKSNCLPLLPQHLSLLLIVEGDLLCSTIAINILGFSQHKIYVCNMTSLTFL